MILNISQFVHLLHTMKFALDRKLQTIVVASFILMHLSFILIIPLTIYILTTKYCWLMILYLIWIIIDRKSAEGDSRRLNSDILSLYWHYLQKYFPLRLVKVDDCVLDQKKNYLFCQFPHGVIPIGTLVNFISGNCRKIFPEMTSTILTIPFFFYIPFQRELYLRIGMAVPSEKSLNNLLSHQNGGQIAVLQVGGASEIPHSKPGKHTIVLNNRKGFIRLALQNGAPLVPVYSFGETDTFEQIAITNAFVKKMQQIFIKIARFRFIFLRGGLFCFVPKRTTIVTVVGKPIEVPKIPNPSKADIDKVHNIFKNELINLFNSEKYKYVTNPEQTDLKIL